MTASPRHDPPISGIPAEFTAAKAMAPALYAGACQALIYAALSGSDDEGRPISPEVIVRAQIDLTLWLGVARYEQQAALDAGRQTVTDSKADGRTPKSSYSIRS
jgi:hypothetical protein